MSFAKIVFFDGVDRAGKSTLLREVWKIAKKDVVTVDRGIISNIVYAQNHREEDEIVKNSVNLASLLDVTGVAKWVYVTADLKDIEARSLEEGVGYNEQDTLSSMKAFDDAFFLSNIEPLVVNSSSSSAKELAVKVVEALGIG